MVAARSDGLGERLNAMINGMFLAEKFDFDFGFHWSSSGTWQKLGADDAHHAVTPRDEFFSSEFIEKYALDGFARKGYVELAGKGMVRRDLDSIERTPGFKGWLAPRVDIREILSPELHPDEHLNLGMMFGRIAFSPRIHAAVSAARDVDLPDDLVAFHLRSGDIFYGPYRKLVSFTYKGVTLPIAKAMIGKFMEDGCPLLLFGQDMDVLRYLSTEIGGVVAADLLPSWMKRADEIAMFEIVLMSRCRLILGGSSGFAKQASWIGGTEVKQPKDFFNSTRQVEISTRDLADNADYYNPLQSAFAYWYAYYCGRQSISFEDADFLLARACHYDGDNQLYVLKRASNCFRHGHFDAGDRHIKRMIDLEIQANPEGDIPSLRILVSKTLNRYNLSEDFQHFERASSKGMPYAALCDCVVRRDKGTHIDCARLQSLAGESGAVDPAFLLACKRLMPE